MNYKGSRLVRVGLGENLKGRVLLEVDTLEQAKMAEEAGAAAVIVNNPQSERLSQSYLETVQQLKHALSISIIARCRIGHFVEAQILEALKIHFIDEFERFKKADYEHYINKHKFRVPFMSGAEDFASALCRIAEGAAVIRTQAESEENAIHNTVNHLRNMQQTVKRIATMNEDELMQYSIELGAPYHLVLQVAETQKLPVPLIAQGYITEISDLALMMQLGAEAVIIHSKIFTRQNAYYHIKNLVLAMEHYREPEKLLEISLQKTQQESVPKTHSDMTAQFLARLNP